MNIGVQVAVQAEAPLVATADAPPVRILFVMAWLVVGGEETEVRLLARTLDPARWRIEVLPCFRMAGMPDLTHRQLEEAGVAVDRAAYDLSFEDTVAYLERRMADCDIVVACQNVVDLYPALERMAVRPPLIEHGGLVSEALAGPKHFTTRYVGVCDTIRDAAAGQMSDRPQHARAIPSMVDLAEFREGVRGPMRAALGLADDALLVGWVGRLDRKKRVEDFIAAAALVDDSRVRFVVVGGPDAFMPEYEAELHGLAEALGLAGRLMFLGDRADVPDLMMAMDIFVWLSRGEGMPHVIAEAAAAGLPVVATADNGVVEQIVDGASGLFVPHEDPVAVVQAIGRLAADASLRQRLGQALQTHVARTYATRVVTRQWEALFAEVLAERDGAGASDRPQAAVG